MKKETILRHSRVYGYIKIPKLEVYKRKIKLLEEKSKKQIMNKQNYQKQITEIRQTLGVQSLMSKIQISGAEAHRASLLNNLQERMSIAMIQKKE